LHIFYLIKCLSPFDEHVGKPFNLRGFNQRQLPHLPTKSIEKDRVEGATITCKDFVRTFFSVAVSNGCNTTLMLCVVYRT